MVTYNDALVPLEASKVEQLGGTTVRQPKPRGDCYGHVAGDKRFLAQEIVAIIWGIKCEFHTEMSLGSARFFVAILLSIITTLSVQLVGPRG